MDHKDYTYPACVGLSVIHTSRWPWRQHRTEVWTDMVSRPYPLYLKIVPNNFIWYDKTGAKLSWSRILQSLFR